jgi:hypothetical protein
MRLRVGLAQRERHADALQAQRGIGADLLGLLRPISANRAAQA